MFNSPFREEVPAERSGRQQLDHLLRTTPPHERVILVGICIVLASLAVWTLFGSVVRSVTADGLLIEPGVRHDVVSSEPGYLLEYLVVPGDHVEAGGGIARQSVPELERETAGLRDRLALLEGGIIQSGAGDGASGSLLEAARVALLEMEARRSAKELLVSQIAGEVAALQSAPGEYLPTGTTIAQIRDVSGGPELPPLAALRVARHVALRLQPGMQTSVEVMMPGGEATRLQGEVAAVSTGPLPGWLAAMPPAVVRNLHRVDVVLHDASGFRAPDGTPCRIRIVLGRQAPVALLGFDRS